MLPLQLAVRNKAPPELLERIEAAYPLEQWSLHDAVKVASVEAFAPKVLKLITPEACAEKDSDGRLPLHHGATNQASAEVVALLRGARLKGHRCVTFIVRTQYLTSSSLTYT